MRKKYSQKVRKNSIFAKSEIEKKGMIGLIGVSPCGGTGRRAMNVDQPDKDTAPPHSGKPRKENPLVSAVLPRTPLRPTAGVLIFKEISN